MDGLVSVCHFCEQHGPSVVFCTQAHQQLPSVEQLQLARECSSVNSDECAACRAFSMEKGCLVTESSSVCYVSSRVPLSAGVASLLHRACVRSLSCEVCPGGEGCVYFGDDVRGHALSYIFSLRDLQARGLKRWFSVVVLVKQRAYLLSAWTFLVHHLQQVVQQLQERALQVFNKEGGSLRRVQTELPHRQKASVRGLSELVDSPLIWARLHTANVWLMAAAGARLVEVMAPACDPFSPAGPTPGNGGHLARDEAGLVAANPVDFVVDVARHADDSEAKIEREIIGGDDGGSEFCLLNKDGKVRDGTDLGVPYPVDIAVDVARHAGDSDLKIARKVIGGIEFFCLNKGDEVGDVEKDVCSRAEKLVGGERNDNRNNGAERRVEIGGSSQEKVIAATKPVSINAPLQSSLDVKVDSPCEITVTSENENSLPPSRTSLTSDKFSQNLKSVSDDPKNNSLQVDDPVSRRLPSTDKSPHDQMSGNDVDINSLSGSEVLTLRDLRELLGGDQFGILLQHLLLGFPLMILCAQDASAAPAASLLQAFRCVLPRFLHSLVSVTTKMTACSDQLKNVNHSNQCKEAINDNINNTFPDNERKFVQKSSQFAKIYEGTSSTFVPSSVNYYRLPSSPSIEAYDALEIDTLVLVVTAPQALSLKNVNESNISMCRNASYASLPKDSSGIQIPNFQSKTFDTSDFSCPTDRTSTDLNEPASKSRQFIKRCKFRLEDVSGRPYHAASAVAFASEALHRDWCALVRTVVSACNNSALRDDTLRLTVHHALLSWCSKAKLWDSLLAQQRTRVANAALSTSTATSAATDPPASPKPKNSFGFSLSPPQWAKFLSSSRPKKQSDSSSQRRDKHCDRYEAVGLYPSLYDSSALGDDISSLDAQRVYERHNLNSNAPVSISSEDASQVSSKSNTNVFIGFHPSDLDRAPESSHSSGYNSSATESPRKTSTVASSPSPLTAQSSSALKPDISKAKLDLQGKLVNKLYPSISEEDVLMPSSYNILESQTRVTNPDLFVRPVSSLSSLTSTVGPNMFTPETLDPASLTSLTSLSAAIGLPVSQLQKILLAVGASEVDVPLLQCWAFHLRCNSSSSGFR